MPFNRTRSVSPQTTPRSETLQRLLKNGIKSTLGSFLNRFRRKLAQNDTNDNHNLVNFETNVGLDDELANNFTSEKKRRLSYLPRDPPGNVPRSKTLGNNKGIYQAYFDSVQTLMDEKSNDLETRVTGVADGLNVPEPDFKDPSPGAISFSHIGSNSRNESVIHHGQLVHVGNEDVDNGQNTQEEAPLIIEHEFAPMYRDTDGNIVRPAFINIDPRERYHLVQLKKSVEASEALQRRLKYMIDPNETTSRSIDATKSDATTQTQNSSYLDTKLIMTNKRRNASGATSSRKKRRTVNSHGCFSGDFLYDVESPAAAPSKSLNGYLGSLTKVKFSEPASEKISTVNEDDHNPPYKKFSKDFAATTDKRVGLDKSFKSGEKINVTLDTEYLDKKNKLSSLLNIQEGSDQQDKKPSALPSTGFKFSIDSKEINSAIDSINKTDNVPASASSKADTSAPTEKPKSQFNFGTIGSTAPKPALSFEDKKDTNKAETTGISSAPSFSFGKKDNASQLEPSMKRAREHGELSTNLANGGGTAPKPLFNFGKSSSNDDAAKPEKPSVPSFSFSKSTATTAPSEGSVAKNGGDSTSTTSFVFGGASTGNNADKSEAKTTAPAFTFGKSKDTDTDAVSFGTKSSAESGNKSDTKVPSFSFGASKETTPVFGGKKETTPLFDSKEGAKESTDFAFGAKEAKEQAPAFSLGAKEDKKEAAPFTFGAKDDKKEATAFTFAAKEDKKEAAPFTFGSSAKKEATPFTFGAKDDKKETTPFTFGGATPPTKAAMPFTFGGSGNTGKPAAAGTASPSTTTTTPFAFGSSNPPAKPFTFGTNSQAPAFLASRTLSPAFGNNAAPKAPSAPAFGTNGGFGLTTTPHTPAQMAAAPQNGTPAFSFNFGSREPTPDPASIFGAAGGGQEPSMTFAAANANPNTSFTPPPISGNPMVRNRKIAQMRLRRR